MGITSECWEVLLADEFCFWNQGAPQGAKRRNEPGTHIPKALQHFQGFARGAEVATEPKMHFSSKDLLFLKKNWNYVIAACLCHALLPLFPAASDEYFSFLSYVYFDVEFLRASRSFLHAWDMLSIPRKQRVNEQQQYCKGLWRWKADLFMCCGRR